MGFVRNALIILVLASALPLNAFYSMPGIATFRGADWVGSEDLYNLSTDIGLFVEIIQPAGQPFAISEANIQERVASILKSSGLTAHMIFVPNFAEPKLLPKPIALASPPSSISPSMPVKPMTTPSAPHPTPPPPPNQKKPSTQQPTQLSVPLPALQILIMLQPVEKGVAAYCAAQLLEVVELHRIFLRPEIVYQAITWQKQELLLVAPEQLTVELDRTIRSLASSFADRYKSDSERGSKGK